MHAVLDLHRRERVRDLAEIGVWVRNTGLGSKYRFGFEIPVALTTCRRLTQPEQLIVTWTVLVIILSADTVMAGWAMHSSRRAGLAPSLTFVRMM